MTSIARRGAGIAAAALLTLSAPAVAGAQAPGPLPTAPGADRAVNGGLSEAHASLPGGPNRSPLEPYLVLWLLPLSGLVAVGAGAYADRRTQDRARSRAVRRSGTTTVGRTA